LFRFFFFLFAGWGLVCPGGYAGLAQGWLWEYRVLLIAHLLVCISQAGLEPVSGGAGDLLVSQCNVV
jgi:hypothetical protein